MKKNGSNNINILLKISSYWTVRSTMSKTALKKQLKEMDKHFTTNGIDEDDNYRISMVLENLKLMTAAFNEAQEDEDEMCNILVGFIYAFCKPLGTDKLDIINGLITFYTGDSVNYNPCLCQSEFDDEVYKISTFFDGSEGKSVESLYGTRLLN